MLFGERELRGAAFSFPLAAHLSSVRSNRARACAQRIIALALDDICFAYDYLARLEVNHSGDSYLILAHRLRPAKGVSHVICNDERGGMPGCLPFPLADQIYVAGRRDGRRS